MAISCQDRKGRPVRCDQEWWEVHVLYNHPEMQQLRRETVRTIQNPDAEYLDAHNPNRLVYYSARGVGILTAIEMIKVSVEYSGNEGGLITAYAVTRIKQGETLLWQRPSTPQDK